MKFVLHWSPAFPASRALASPAGAPSRRRCVPSNAIPIFARFTASSFAPQRRRARSLAGRLLILLIKAFVAFAELQRGWEASVLAASPAIRSAPLEASRMEPFD